MRFPAAICLLLLAVSHLVQAGAGPTTPPPASAERKAICDALRVPVMKDFGVKPIFVISTLNVVEGWAFLVGNLQRVDGSVYNAEKLYESRFGSGDRIFDGDSVYGLLRKQGGKWKAIECHVGPTDVSFLGWRKEYGAPRALFGPHAKSME